VAKVHEILSACSRALVMVILSFVYSSFRCNDIRT